MRDIRFKSLLSLSICLVVMLSNVSVAQNKPELETFSQVEALFDDRQFEKAKELLTRMDVRGPLAVEKYLWLSRVQLELGAGIAAATAIERARELSADYASTAVPFAKALLVQGKYRDALSAMRGVSIPKDQQVDAYIVSGDANFALQNSEQARRDYLLAIETNDNKFQPYLGLARLALKNENLSGAHSLAQKASLKDPNNTMVQYTLGLINRYLGEAEIAENHFLEAVRLFPNNLMANIELASIRINQNRIDEAEGYLDIIYAVAPNQPMAIYLTAVIQATRGDYEESELLLQRVPQLTSNYLPAIYVRGMVAYQLGKNEPAVRALEQVLKVRPNNKPARMALAGAYTNQQRPRAALRVLQPLLTTEETADVTILSMAATASMAAGDIESGKVLFQRITDLQKDQGVETAPSATSKLAMAQFVSGNTDEAISIISSISGGIGTEIRELGVMASMQIRNADIGAARITVSRIIDAAPQRALGYNMLGTLAFKENKFESAVNAFSEALQRNPEYFTALRNRGLAYFRLKDFANAEVDLKRLLELLPNDARSKAVLGKTLLTTGKAEDSLLYFKEAIRDIPNSIALSGDYAEALALSGNTTRAIEQARATAKLGADKPEALKRMGLLLLDLGQAAAAERPLSRHVAFRPNSGEAHLLHGRALLSMGLYTGSKMSFDRARHSTTEKPEKAIIDWYLFAADALAKKQEPALSQLAALDMTKRPADISASVIGDILMHAGQLAEAENAYRTVYMKQKTGSVATGLSRALSAQNRGPAAIEVLVQYIADHPEDRFVRTELATRYEAGGQFEAAAEQYREILRNGVADAKTAAKLASVYLRLNNRQSIRLVEQAFLISPDDPYILDVHGWVLLQAGRDTSKAIKSLEKAVRRSPANASYKYHLGMAYLAQNRKNDALQTLTQAINLNPNFEGADEARRQIDLLGAAVR